MSEIGSALPYVTQQMSPPTDDIGGASDVGTVVDAAGELVATFGENAVVGALKNMALDDVSVFMKELLDSNDELGDGVRDFVKDEFDSLMAKEKAATTADAFEAVEGSVVADSWQEAVADMLREIIRLLADENDQENGMGSTEGEQKTPKESSSSGGGEAAAAGGEGAGEAAGGGEGADGSEGAGEAAGGEGAAGEGGGEAEAAGGGGGEAAGGEGGGQSTGGDGFPGNWLEKWAETMAKAQINWINQADEQQDIMQEMSGKDDTASRDAFIMAQSKYTADMQMFSMTGAATSTSLKTVGESLAGIARKQ